MSSTFDIQCSSAPALITVRDCWKSFQGKKAGEVFSADLWLNYAAPLGLKRAADEVIRSFVACIENSCSKRP